LVLVWGVVGLLWGCCGVVVGLVPVSVKLPQIWWVQPRTTSVVAFSEGKLIPRASSKERCDAMTPSTPNSLVCAADVPFQLEVQATSYGSRLTCSACGPQVPGALSATWRSGSPETTAPAHGTSAKLSSAAIAASVISSSASAAARCRNSARRAVSILTW
jgi:hypothetical protein